MKATGFAPGSTVATTDNGASTGPAAVGADGTFGKHLCLDTAKRCGSHKLVASGADADGEPREANAYVTAPCAVTQAIPSGPGQRGARALNYGLIAALVVTAALVLGGLLQAARLFRKGRRVAPAAP